MEGKTAEPETFALQTAAEQSVRCKSCGAESAAGGVFCSTCRSVLTALPVEDGTASRTQPEPRPGQVAALQSVRHSQARLPRRCPACGRPTYPDETRCSHCGADPVAAARAKARIVPRDADGHDLPDVEGWTPSGPQLYDLIPREYRPVYDVIVLTLAIIYIIGIILLLLWLHPPSYIVTVLTVAIVLFVVAIILSIVSTVVRLLFGDRRLYDVVVPIIAAIVLVVGIALQLLGFGLQLLEIVLDLLSRW